MNTHVLPKKNVSSEKTSSFLSINEEVSKYIDQLITDKLEDTIKNTLIIENGLIIDDRINKFQKR